MKTYTRIAGEGFRLVWASILSVALAAIYAALLIASLPFFLLGLIKRGVVAAFTGGDPLVP